MGSSDLQLWTRIGTMNLAGAPDSDPARRKGISIEPHRSAALRFMERSEAFVWLGLRQKMGRARTLERGIFCFAFLALPNYKRTARGATKMPSTSNPQPPIADHELLSCVGTGSYGQVWLARHNLLGIFRAVKIVHRARFDSDKPFEREFQGIQKFEPISRTHPGLIAVLHVGRNGAETGCFYYIMEVADDVKTGQRIEPSTYKPCTLASEIDRRGRFPMAECARIAGALCSALAQLHDQGLVHRDIKPSNIIFVNGVPKLADVGLVTSSGDSVSDVGTT